MNPLRPAVVAMSLWLAATTAAADPLPTTRLDFALPGTQPLTITDPLSPPQACAPCHADYGQPEVEPVRNWRGSMMAQAGRDPLFYAALAIANQDASHSGETCLRCHLSKGWLEGRSAPEDGSAMTAEDREGVQCSTCHRLVDPTPGPEAPAEDAAILAGLDDPPTSTGSAQFVIDPLDRLRGPFDVTADLGSDPHAPARSTLLSPFHTSAELCGTCHDVSNPAFTCDANGCVANPFDQIGDNATGFPEQRTYSEWAASSYASEGVYAPQFGRNRDVVSTCQDCHMPAVTGRAAKLGVTRDDLPLHEMVGGNTFIPKVLPAHPFFGSEVDAEILASTVDKATTMLRKGATVRAWIDADTLTVRVVNETGHKLPTGYPDGRRMWLHVRAFDAKGQVAFESGRYVFATADLLADPQLKVWETLHGLTGPWAAALGLPAGESFHLVLNDTVVKDNRIPPRGFTNAAFAVFGGAPVGAAYADGQHWDDTTYPVGAGVVAADVVLYYQTTSKEYVEFLRDENTTNAAGPILFDLWDQIDRSTPVELARVRVETRANGVRRCQKAVAKAQKKLWKTYTREWQRCFEVEAEGRSCDGAARDARLASAEAALAAALGGAADAACAGKDFTPQTIGHPSVCPVPCGAAITLHDLPDLAACTRCMVEALGGAALEASYGVTPPAVPNTRFSGTTLACQRDLGDAAVTLANGWASAVASCQRKQPLDPREPRRDCESEAAGAVEQAQSKAHKAITRCEAALDDLPGCAEGGTANAAAECVDATIGAVAPGYAQVAYP
jgi:hypothetical protein